MTGALAAACVLAWGAAAAQASTAGAAVTSAGPAVTMKTVTTGPSRSLGEPMAAEDTSVSAVTATTFAAAGARVAVWTRRAGASAWKRAGLLLPAGFGLSYDASAAAVAGGPLLVVAGTAPPGESCITNGSVAIASVGADGKLGVPRLVSDQRGTGSFDDRPTVAIGQDGTVWVAWSQGPGRDACQDAGTGDRLEVAVSHDGGKTFGAPVTMPADGGHTAFGARLAPLPGGRVAVSWTETTSGGAEAVLVSILGPGKQVSAPRRVLTGAGPPLALPGASFYDFPAGDLVALPSGGLVVAVPLWRDGASVIALAAGTPGGRWRSSAVSPPAGSDLLLPALGLVSAGDVRLLYAAHTRSGDHLGYEVADIRVSGDGGIVPGGPAKLTSAPAGPGFFELGEELSLTRTPDGLLAAVVVAGAHGAALETAAFTAPLPAAGSATASPRPTAAGTAGTSAAAGTAAAAPARSAPSTAAGQQASGRWPGAVVAAAWAAAVIAGVAVFLTAWRRSRRRTRGRRYSGRHG